MYVWGGLLLYISVILIFCCFAFCFIGYIEMGTFLFARGNICM